MTEPVHFRLPNQDGEWVSSDDLAGSRYILFFYPKAMTPGCTRESCDFRDSHQEFSDAGFSILGVSPDPPAANARFKERERLDFDLLSDEGHELAESLGAWGKKKLYGRTSEGLIRSTFVIGPDGRVEKAYHNVKAAGHVARLKDELLGAGA